MMDDTSVQMTNWQPIDTAPATRQPFSMFVVVAIDADTGYHGAPYTSDPYCVWREVDGSFARWPHPFPPTHWLPLPDYNPRTFTDGN